MQIKTPVHEMVNCDTDSNGSIVYRWFEDMCVKIDTHTYFDNQNMCVYQFREDQNGECDLYRYKKSEHSDFVSFNLYTENFRRMAEQIEEHNAPYID